MKHAVSEITLKNGTKGLFINIPDATVMTFEFNFRAGEYLVPEDKWETPHLMEHVLLGANKRIPKARAFQAEFEKNGASSNASTGSYDITYEAECADFEWDRVLDLLLVAITEPLFLKEEFDSEFGNVREELTARSNNHFRALSLALRQEFGFIAKTDQDRLKLINNVSVEDVRRHYKLTHTTSNMRFVIAGNIDTGRRRKIKDWLEKLDLPLGTGRKELPDEQPRKLRDPLIIKNSSIDNLYFYLDTFMLRRMRDPEVDALNLINAMLTETLYSRILGTAREKGLVYSMSSSFGQTKDCSNWWFGAQIMPTNAAALFSIISSEINKIFNGNLAEKDIQEAKQYQIGRYQRSGQTVGGTMSGYSMRYFFDDQIDDYYKFPARIKAITKDRILQITSDMFARDVWGLGFLGNVDKKQAVALKQQIQPLWTSR